MLCDDHIVQTLTETVACAETTAQTWSMQYTHIPQPQTSLYAHSDLHIPHEVILTLSGNELLHLLRPSTGTLVGLQTSVKAQCSRATADHSLTTIVAHYAGHAATFCFFTPLASPEASAAQGPSSYMHGGHHARYLQQQRFCNPRTMYHEQTICSSKVCIINMTCLLLEATHLLQFGDATYLCCMSRYT